MVTWVDSSKVSTSFIEEYERSTGILPEQKYGVISYAVVSASRTKDNSNPPSKRPKLKAEEQWDVGLVSYLKPHELLLLPQYTVLSIYLQCLH